MIKKISAIVVLSVLLAACATKPDPKDYSTFRASDPRSVLIVPVINHSAEAEAADLFLTTLAIPLAERGFYVFPTNMVKSMMEDDGLADPQLVHSANSTTLAGLFGADSVLYVEIIDWDNTYAVVSSGIVVHFLYTLKDGHTGELLWQEQKQYVHNTSSSSGNIFVDLIATAISAAIDSTKADYTPVAIAANGMALFPAGQGVPFGPYNPNYGNDQDAFPSTGSGRLSNATNMAVSYQVDPSEINQAAPGAEETTDEKADPTDSQPEQ